MASKHNGDRSSTKLISRRKLVQGAAGIAIGLSTSLDALARMPGQIEGVRVGSPITVPNNFGDTWVTAWADDGNLYTPSDDTLCFEIPAFFTKDQVKLFQSDFTRFARQLTAEQKTQWQYGPIGFNRIEGNDPFTLRGTTVNRMVDNMKQDGYRTHMGGPSGSATDGRSWKSSGCAFVDGALYWVVHRDKVATENGVLGRQSAINASIIKSTDSGKTWRRSAKENYDNPMFPESHFTTPYFIDYGRSPREVDATNRYVYAISNNGFWDNGDQLILGRVLRERIGLLNGSDWEFFTGGDGLRDENWTTHAPQARPVLENPGKLGMTGAVYLPARQRYMMIGWYYPHGNGYTKNSSTTTVWDFYEAPKPWGPWKLIHSHTWEPQGYYCPCICPKFQSADRVYATTAGDFNNWWDYYHLTIVPIDLA